MPFEFGTKQIEQNAENGNIAINTPQPEGRKTYLIGDIGGTNFRLATFQNGEMSNIKVYSTTQCAHMDEALHKYMEETNLTPSSCCLAIAGPIVDQTVVLTNQSHKTLYDAKKLGKTLGFPVKFVNDFEAVGLYIHGGVDEKHLHVIQPNQQQETADRMHKPILYMGAGTGLGVGFISNDAVVASEGGHTRFPAETEFELAFIREIHAEIGYNHLSCDRVVSGLGLQRLYRFCAQQTFGAVLEGIDDVKSVFSLRFSKQTDLLGKKMREILGDVDPEDPQCQQKISKAALEGNAAGELLMGIFFYWYGKAVADMIVTFCPQSVYLVGGILLKNLPLIKQHPLVAGTFHKAIERKGRLGVITKSVAIYVLLEPEVGLLGAANGAARQQ